MPWKRLASGYHRFHTNRFIPAWTLSESVERCEIVEETERAAVRRRDEVVVLDDQVVNWHNGEVTLQGLPARAVVKGYVYAELAAGVEQAPPSSRGILAHDADKVIGRDPAGDAAPRLAVVGRLEDVRFDDVDFVVCFLDVGGPCVICRSIVVQN